MSAIPPRPSVDVLVRDASTWDAFVSSTEHGSYLQLDEWRTVKAVNGWKAVRVVAEGATGPIGGQVLVRRARPLPWAFAYAPRGPVTDDWSTPAIQAWTARLGDGLRSAGRVSHLRIDPEIERDGIGDPDGSLRRALRDAGWRPAPKIQPDTTRIIDLRADEGALWGDLRKKWRQYVNKARSGGVTVTEAGGERLGDFYRIISETAQRAGFIVRAASAYQEVWDALHPVGAAQLLFAESQEGEPLASLFLVRCGPRVVEPYGGMTAAGADTRANYLLKWEAIRRSREAGATSYDLWGLAHPGIAHFKTGFGGREVRYIGAWDLVFDPLGHRAYDGAIRASEWLALRRHGISGSRDGGGGRDALG
jgi:lipid II:glycine glycyltransferase (peptidoglycan interpeptide bridge formation enzyme)